MSASNHEQGGREGSMNALELNKKWRTPPLKWIQWEFNIQWDEGEKIVSGWISPCGQFGIDVRTDDNDEDDIEAFWNVNHLATGLRIVQPLAYDLNEDQTKAFVELISPLTDWNIMRELDPKLEELGAKVKTILATHFPKPLES